MTIAHPLVLLLAIPLVGMAVAFWWKGNDNLGEIRRRVALGVRVGLLLALVLGLAGLSLDLPQNRVAVAVVADVSASTLPGRSGVTSFIDNAARKRPASGRLGIVAVGGDARVEDPVSSISNFGGFESQVNANSTNLSTGLLLGNSMLPTGYDKRITVLTDGWENSGNALATVRLLRSLGVRVDVVPIKFHGGPEVMVDGVDLPADLRTKEHFVVSVDIRSTVTTTTSIELLRGGELLKSEHVQLHAGLNHFSFPQPPLAEGFHTYEVSIDPAEDTQPENNTGSGFTLVAGSPRVLVVAPSRGTAGNVLDSLHTTGIHAQFMTPGKVSPLLGVLDRYSSIVIVNTPAYVLPTGFLNAMVPFVRDLGHGLVVIGGNQSYGVGDYENTGLEKALPVSMALPKRKLLPSAAVVLIIEDLESYSQVNESTIAAKDIVRTLNPRDWVAVNSAEQNGYFPVPLEHVTNRVSIDRRIDHMTSGDPETYGPDLRASFRALENVPSRVKHIILLGDGDAPEGSYCNLVAGFRKAGVTVSTVGTNGNGYSDMATMRTIARCGGGRYYDGNDPNRIPQIFLREARTVARSGIVTGKFYPEELSSDSMLRDLHGMPPLTGYVATTPKPTGDIILASKKLDPVLASWQLGLGRSVAWTSDATGAWTQSWLAAPGANRFWGDLVGWTLPAHQSGSLFVASSASQGVGRVTVSTPASLGPEPQVSARILSPTRHSETVKLQPSGPGQFAGVFPATNQGPYFVTVEATGDGKTQAGSSSLDVPFSAEYLTTGTNMPFIHALAKAGGGQVVSNPSSVWRGDLPAVNSTTSLSGFLWLLGLLLLPVDIGVRRLVVTRRDIDDMLATVRKRQPQPLEDAAVFPLNTIRRSRADRASQTATAATAREASTGAGETATRGQEKAAAPRMEAAAKPSSGARPPSTSSRLLESKRQRR